MRVGGGPTHCDGRGFDLTLSDGIAWRNKLYENGSETEPALL